jgi:hypothetical protein
MDEVVAFVQHWLKEQWRVDEAYYTLPLDKYNREVEKLDKLFADKGDNPLMKQVVPADDEGRELQQEKVKAGITNATLMLVRRYEHPELGTLYRAYVSGAKYPGSDPSYTTNEYVQPKKDGLKFVARYIRCTECDLSGVLNGKPCPECKGIGWTHSRGLEIGDPGRVVDVRRLDPPEAGSIDREDYDSVEGYVPKKAGKKK